MKTRDVLLLLLCMGFCSLIIGWFGGRTLDEWSDYGEAEAMASALNHEAEKAGAWPEEKSVHYRGRERLKDGKGQVVVIVNEHFKLRLPADRFVPQIERTKQGH